MLNVLKELGLKDLSVQVNLPQGSSSTINAASVIFSVWWLARSPRTVKLEGKTVFLPQPSKKCYNKIFTDLAVEKKL